MPSDHIRGWAEQQAREKQQRRRRRLTHVVEVLIGLGALTLCVVALRLCTALAHSP